jgi:hypothetical protein
MLVHYILRISAPHERLYDFIHDVHRSAERAGLVVATTTYIIMAKWARLSLREALMLPRLQPDHERFREYRIVPRIGNEVRAELINWSSARQLDLIDTVEHIVLAWDRIRPWTFPRDQHDLERELMIGLIRDDLARLGDVCGLLLGGVEDWASAIIKERLTADDFLRLKQTAGVPSQRDADQLLLNEKLRIINGVAQEGLIIAKTSTSLQSVLAEDTNRVRNAVTHREFERIGRAGIVETIQRCSNFLSWWSEVGQFA